MCSICECNLFFRAFTGDLWNNHKKGAYKCVVCGKELFLSDTKFDSGSGWPSFSKEVSPAAVDKREDISHGMARTEVTCSNVSGLNHISGALDKFSLGQVIPAITKKF